MEISVIIPVYNAEKYIDTAVKSALIQKETSEIVLIEDGSSDKSLEMCLELQNKYPKVRLLCHKNHKNRGVSESRNFGIRNSHFDLIAFLDADDFYLPNRFAVAKKIFSTIKDIDGVYEAVAVIHDGIIGPGGLQYKIAQKLITFNEKVKSTMLFDSLVSGEIGHLHLNGLLVKKEMFNRAGYFLKNLKLHQDSAIFIQMSFNGKLVPGSIDKPVAIKRIHSNNRFLGKDECNYSRLIMWETIFFYSQKKKIRKQYSISLLYKYIYYFAKFLLKPGKDLENLSKRAKLLLFAFLKNPLFFIYANFLILNKIIFRRKSSSKYVYSMILFFAILHWANF